MRGNAESCQDFGTVGSGCWMPEHSGTVKGREELPAQCLLGGCQAGAPYNPLLPLFLLCQVSVIEFNARSRAQCSYLRIPMTAVQI